MITDEEVCCARMKNEIEEFRQKEIFDDEDFKPNFLVSSIWYDESWREYKLLVYKEKDNYYGSPIDYCPWCGKKLPKWLDPKNVIMEEYGDDYVKYPGDSGYKELPPEVKKEFETDEWWKKRKIGPDEDELTWLGIV